MSTQPRQRCFHCTETVEHAGRWQVDFDGDAHDVCCPGCEAIANTIIAAGLDDYYRFRTEAAVFGQVPEALEAELDAFVGWDAPEFAERFLIPTDTSDDNGTRDVTLAVEGLRCGACIWLLERSLGALPGVEQVHVNYATERARVRFDPGRLPLSQLLRRAMQVGYRMRPYDAAEREAAETRNVRTERQRLFVAALGSMQVMMYALPAYLVPEAEIERRFIDLLHVASLVLTLPVMLYSAWPFLRGAWRDVQARSPGMDVPVAIGLLVAFTASVINTLRGDGEVWFDSVSMFVFLLLGARALEAAARRRARRALDVLGEAVPDMATLGLDNGARWEQVPSARLVPGDIVRVSAGNRVPADGKLCSAIASVDMSLLSGESVPVTVHKGDAVPGGAIVASTPIELEVTHARHESTHALLSDLVERGSSERPAVAQMADKVARVFVSTLLVVVVAVFAFWCYFAPDRAAQIAIATLIVSCPCALSLATPAALAAATGRLLKERLLVTRGNALETAATVTDVVFDKTGTLTEGRPRVQQVAFAETTTETDTLQIVHQLESGSAHPHANALRTFVQQSLGDEDRAALELTDIEHIVGRGVQARDGDDIWRLGAADFCAVDAASQQQWRQRNADPLEAPSSEVWLSRQSSEADAPITCEARFTLSDSLREEAETVAQELAAAGYRLHLYSGDRESVVSHTASRLGIDDACAGLTPDGKREAVARLQAQGRRVLMVGDGLNDAPVMALADCSLAIGEATDLARSAADVVALGSASAHGRDVLQSVPRLLGSARATHRIIRQNLIWAAGYNATMIPLTAAGLVPPWGAAIGMAASSVLVSANALRLLRAGRQGGRTIEHRQDQANAQTAAHTAAHTAAQAARTSLVG